MKNGGEVLERYQKGRWIYDDLGAETRVQHFGTVLEPMTEILLSRYEEGMHASCLMTTNLGSDEIEERYGLRIRSRLREMMNLVAFGKDSGDKRK